MQRIKPLQNPCVAGIAAAALSPERAAANWLQRCKGLRDLLLLHMLMKRIVMGGF
jgi:hypothetical protein